MGKSCYDWYSIRTEYICATPAVSQADLCRKYGMAIHTICQKAKKENWDGLRKEFQKKVQGVAMEKHSVVVADQMQVAIAECEVVLHDVLQEIRTRLSGGTFSNYDLVKTARVLALQLENMGMASEQVNHSWATIRWAVLKRDGFRCHYCGRTPEDDGVKLHVDHVMPRSLGGTNDMDNLVAACETCNEAKSDELLEVDCRG